eukprot:SAG31_NODE_6097_length_2171_cov_39.703524_2_plen_73_part_00
MANRDRDPTIGKDGKTAQMDFQFYTPYKFSAYSEEVVTDFHVIDSFAATEGNLRRYHSIGLCTSSRRSWSRI